MMLELVGDNSWEERIMKMKQMPYKLSEGAIEQAKYRAKMAVREVAHPVVPNRNRVQWRWATVMTAVAVVVMGVIGFVKYYDEIFKPLSPMEELIAEMQTAPDEVISDLAADTCYYLEDINSL